MIKRKRYDLKLRRQLALEIISKESTFGQVSRRSLIREALAPESGYRPVTAHLKKQYRPCSFCIKDGFAKQAKSKKLYPSY